MMIKAIVHLRVRPSSQVVVQALVGALEFGVSCLRHANMELMIFDSADYKSEPLLLHNSLADATVALSAANCS